jgi:MYXO-CTERM domain-containing protein
VHGRKRADTVLPMSIVRTLALVAALPILFVSTRASADIPPENECTTAGTSCNTAEGPSGSYTASGTCVSTTCGHLAVLPDGATGTTQNPCTLCMVAEGGTSSSSGSSSGGSSSGSAAPAKSGCTVGSVGADTLAPFGLMAAGAAIVAVSRRRRAKR